MPNTKEIDLYMPAAEGYGAYAGCATIEVDPISGRMIGLKRTVEILTPGGSIDREIDCLAGSDSLPYDDKPVAAQTEFLARLWLIGDEGMEWTQSLVLTPGEIKQIQLENAYDLARERVQ